MKVTWLAVVSLASTVLHWTTGHASALHAGVVLPEAAFEEKKRSWQSTNKRVCFHCVEKRKCKVCEIWKQISDYIENEWQHAAWKESANGKCTACVNSHQRSWYCKMCKVLTKESDFRMWQMKYTEPKINGKQICAQPRLVSISFATAG